MLASGSGINWSIDGNNLRYEVGRFSGGFSLNNGHVAHGQGTFSNHFMTITLLHPYDVYHKLTTEPIHSHTQEGTRIRVPFVIQENGREKMVFSEREVFELNGEMYCSIVEMPYIYDLGSRESAG